MYKNLHLNKKHIIEALRVAAFYLRTQQYTHLYVHVYDKTLNPFMRKIYFNKHIDFQLAHFT